MDKFKRIYQGATALLCILLLVNCSSQEPDDITQGYVEARLIYIASNSAGKMINCPIYRGNFVKNNQLLFQLDPEPQQSELARNQADLKREQEDLANLINSQRQTVIEQIVGELNQAKADLVLAQKTLPRYQELYKTHAIDKQTLDNVLAQEETAKGKVIQYQAKLADANLGAREHEIAAQKAQVAAAEANVKNLQWELSQKTQYAPQAGQIFDTFYKVGEYVPAGAAVTAILTADNTKIIFYLPETKLSMIKLGQTISFTCDSCNNAQTAKIDYISPTSEYTPPVIYSRSARAKLVYRIEAQIPLDVALNYHPGQPVDVKF